MMIRVRWERFSQAARDYAWGVWMLGTAWGLSRRNRRTARALNRRNAR